MHAPQVSLKKALNAHHAAQHAFAAQAMNGPMPAGLLGATALATAARIMLGMELDCSDMALHLANEATLMRFHSAAVPMLRQGSTKPSGQALTAASVV